MLTPTKYAHKNGFGNIKNKFHFNTKFFDASHTVPLDSSAKRKSINDVSHKLGHDGINILLYTH